MPYDDISGTIVRKICMACSREFGGGLMHCPHDGNMLAALPQDQWEGRRLADKYRIDRRLGTGGMGVVYLAWHEYMDRWVAVKMLKQSFVEDASSVQRFQREAQAASRLKHPNVITLYDFGMTPQTGQPYMVMDYLVSTHPDAKHRARGLSEEIKETKGMPVERAIHVLAQACDALEHAHRQGVIHRDVKPANIMIVPEEADPYFVKVVDFGVAKLLPINNGGADIQGLTQIGEVCGSPVYMSPEQCIGQALDPRADIYSMGIVLYEAIAGKLPLMGKNMVETMQLHQTTMPPPFKEVRPDLFVPEKLEEIIMRALSKHPHARQQSMAELAQDLRFSIPRPGQTPTLKTREILPLPEPEEENRPTWIMPAVIGGIVVALAAVGLFMFFGAKQAPAPQPVPPARTAAQPQSVPSPTAVQPSQVSPTAAVQPQPASSVASPTGTVTPAPVTPAHTPSPSPSPTPAPRVVHSTPVTHTPLPKHAAHVKPQHSVHSAPESTKILDTEFAKQQFLNLKRMKSTNQE